MKLLSGVFRDLPARRPEAQWSADLCSAQEVGDEIYLLVPTRQPAEARRDWWR